MQRFAAIRKNETVGCLARVLRCAAIIYLIPSLICGVLFLLLFLHATYAGAWAASLIVPIPENSQFIKEITYSNLGYDYQLNIYQNPLGMEELQTWFRHNLGPAMSFPQNPAKPGEITYYAIERNSTAYTIYVIAGTIAKRRPSYVPGYDPFSPCIQVSVYTFDAMLASKYSSELQELDNPINPDSSFFIVRNCWPNWQ